MGWPDDLKSSVSNSCEAADPSISMIGCQFQLPITETELVPQMGKFLNEHIIVSVDPYLGRLALLNFPMLMSIGHVMTSTMDTAKVLSE